MVRLAVILAALALALAGCGGDGDEAAPPADTGTTAPSTTEADTTTEGAAAGVIPETPLAATLDQTYKVAADGSPGIPTPNELPVQPGSVEAWWYVSGDRYVVLYAGVSLTDTEPFCPGNSIQIGSAFENISNSPTGQGGCPGRLGENLAGAGAGVQACGPLLLYVTEIPADAEGTLYGSIEALRGTDLVGLTSSVATADGEAPEIELGPTLTVPEGALPGGETEVSC